MPRPAATMALAILALPVSVTVLAQSPPSPPGPYVVDIRATMSGLPSNSAFHPVLPAGTLVPKRGFGIGVGGHVYLASVGIARVGIGLDVLRVRGTAVTAAATTTSAASPPAVLSASDAIDVATTMTAIAPQLSFNFGTRDGWSYVSGGYGAATFRTAASGQRPTPLTGSTTVKRDDGRAAAINYGGGARWFIKERVAVGFDLRLYRVATVGTRPSTRCVAATVGLSVR